MDCRNETEGLRADVFLSEAVPALSRSAAQKLCEDGLVYSESKAVKKNLRLRAGQVLSFTLPEPEAPEAKPEDIPLDVVYEDGDLLVVNKPKGMVVHPAAGHTEGTLVNALLHRCPDLSGINGTLRPGIVHRIDMDTTGLLIVAKNDFAHRALAAQLQDHSLRRTYVCIVTGNLKQDSGTVDAPIGRHPTDRKKMAVTEKNSRRAVTHYTVLARYPGYTYVRCQLETGRTHQIRVHMAYLHHPILGDTVYGSKKPALGLDSQCLHARQLEFCHPRSGEHITLECPLPAYFQNVLSLLEKRLEKENGL